MTLDLAQFHQVFFEECAEMLDSMESALLGLDLPGASATGDKMPEETTEAINTIFRGAHSIKGGAATFAFNDIAGFTHVMETLLDRVREGIKKIARADVDLLLQSVDCLRGMMSAQQSGGVSDAARARDLKGQLEAALDTESRQSRVVSPPSRPATDDRRPATRDSTGEITDEEFDNLLEQLHGPSGAPGASGQSSVDSRQSRPTTDDPRPATHRPEWRIEFRPRPGFFQTGNDPLRAIRALEAFTAVTVHADTASLPAFADMNPEQSYLRWTLELGSGATREKIMEAFAWVEGDSDLKIESLESGVVSRELNPKTEPTVETRTMATEPMSPATTAAPKTPDPRPATPDSRSEGASIRVGIDKIDALINMVGELVITQSMLSQLSENFDMDRVTKLMSGIVQLERNTRELQESVMRIRMLPISFAFNRFPRLVHDLSAKLGKKIELKMTGEQTELDKTVMEKIGDPLVHLVRNSLDHGIEMPAARRAAGKLETGTLHLNAYHQSGNIVIEIVDDGAGLPRDKILKKAMERGLVRDDAGLTDDKIYELIFLPGFSTADTVSDVSGRGVGMDVVRRNIKALGGTVEIRSQEGRGTTITIRLPLTLAILDGQTVRVGNEIYIIPLVSIVESLKIRSEMVNIVAGRGEVIRLRKEYLQVMRLYKVFDAKPHHTNLADGLLVVVEGEGFKAGLYVDELLGQQQIVIKSLEANFKRVEGVAGATILGDGTVALILDVPGLIKLAHRNAVALGVGDVHQPENLAA